MSELYVELGTHLSPHHRAADLAVALFADPCLEPQGCGRRLSLSQPFLPLQLLLNLVAPRFSSRAPDADFPEVTGRGGLNTY